MPKKPSQLEAPNTGLTREDRKNEQICRMIEKAEKQRLKREEKKKLQVLNKATAKVNTVGHKKRKMGFFSAGPRTPLNISIMFSDKVRAQNAANRYFFERKQTIEEKQRLEQEEMWARFAHRQQQLASIYAQQQQQNTAGSAHGASSANAEPQQPGTEGHQGQESALQPSQLTEGQLQQQQTPFYLNAGETGCNYEGEHTGSSCLSSASKRQHLLRTAQGDTNQAAQADTRGAPAEQRNGIQMQASSATGGQMHPLLALSSSILQGGSTEERKEGGDGRPRVVNVQQQQPIVINVQLGHQHGGNVQAPGQPAGSAHVGLGSGEGPRLPRSGEAGEAEAGPEPRQLSQEEKILELTRLSMLNYNNAAGKGGQR